MAGNGAIYRFDPLGSFERCYSTCAGNGETLIQPMLDEALVSSSPLELPDSTGNYPRWTFDSASFSFKDSARCFVNISAEKACEIIVSLFQAAASREITIGDTIDFRILRRSGVTRFMRSIRKRIESVAVPPKESSIS